MKRPAQGASVAEECVPNIGPRGRRRRRNKGLVSLLLAAFAIAWAAARGVTPGWFWLLLAGLYVYAMYGLFQSKEKT